MPSQLAIGVSLKLYFDVARTLEWTDAVVEIAGRALVGGVELWIMPSFPLLPLVGERLRGTAIALGAQDLFQDDRGAYTGEVSGADLAALGCRYVEVGHAERRRLFGETEEVVALKTAAALRNGLIPVLCVGELAQGSPADAAGEVVGQLDSALAAAAPGPVVVAYEPVWAIGAAAPAGVPHISGVCTALSAHLDGLPGREGSRVIYGGSAGPGLLTSLGGAVDGLFLGRFAHDPRALETILDEAAALREIS